MRKNFGKKSWLYPMPVLIVATYNEAGEPNAMTAAWGGMYTINTIGACISDRHKTTANFLATKAFTVSLATAEQIIACDFVGIVSGKDEHDKFTKAGFHAIPSKYVNAPTIEELPMTLECEVVKYDQESNHLVGRIINVSADESILTDGKIDIRKLRPITYDPINHHYIELGEIVGNAFSDGKKLIQGE